MAACVAAFIPGTGGKRLDTGAVLGNNDFPAADELTNEAIACRVSGVIPPGAARALGAAACCCWSCCII